MSDWAGFSGDWLYVIQLLGPRILVALLCGGIVGLEREIKHKPAGIKTNMLICAGAALYTALSVLISGAASPGVVTHGDPGRIAAQIVSGIGFLGGGAILQSRGTVHGLTTAATIWVVAAIGVAVGLGHLGVGIVIALVVVAVLVAITLLESVFLGHSHNFGCDIVIQDPSGAVRQQINDILEQNDLFLEDFNISAHGELQTLHIMYRGRRAASQRFMITLWSINGVKEVQQK